METKTKTITRDFDNNMVKTTGAKRPPADMTLNEIMLEARTTAATANNLVKKLFTGVKVLIAFNILTLLAVLFV